MTSPQPALERLAARAGQLYSLPAVAMKVLELTDNPQVDARALKECVENDPALTGKILRVVNSSLFGLSREVSDLNQALALLGIKPLKLLVLGFSLPPALYVGVGEEVLDRYWRHTLTKAVAARELCEMLFELSGDDAFISGLLQDLGELLLIQELGEPYVKLLERVAAGRYDLATLESESMGFEHTELSSRLLDHWGLPKLLVQAIAPPTAERQLRAGSRAEQALPEILRLAELVARLLADGRQEALPELLDEGQSRHGLSQEQLATMVEDLQDKVSQLAEVLSLQFPKGMDYRDVLAQAHARLAELAEEVAGELARRRAGGLPGDQAVADELQSLAEAVDAVVRRPLPATGEPPAPAAGGFSAGAATAVARAVSTIGTVQTVSPQSGTVPAPTAATAGQFIARTAAPDLVEHLRGAVAACRQMRCPLSLLLAELDRLDDLAASRGAAALGDLRRMVEAACRELDHPYMLCLAHREAGFALVLPDCERREAVEYGHLLADRVRDRAPGNRGRPRRGVTLSVGVATVALPTRNFQPEDLLAGAERCLYGSHASGGGVVKSIEIY